MICVQTELITASHMVTRLVTLTTLTSLFTTLLDYNFRNNVFPLSKNMCCPWVIMPLYGFEYTAF